MRDFIQEYHQKSRQKHGMIIALSLALALGFNFFYFGTPVGQRLQTSVQQATTTPRVHTADLSLRSAGTGSDMLVMTVGTDIHAVSSMSLSFLADPDRVDLVNIFSEDPNMKVVVSKTVPGMWTVAMTWKNPTDIAPGTDLIHISYAKKSKEKVTVTVAESSFRSGNSVYDLTNTPLEF